MEDFLKDIIVKAGQETLTYFGNVGAMYTKTNPTDVVTQADLASEKIMVAAIKSRYPDHGIISEEQGEYNTDREYIWVMDPVDGTRNFATGFPMYCVLLALVKNNEVILGANYDPVHNRLYFAAKGKGAFCNEQKITCSQTQDFKYSYGCASSNITEQKIALYNKLFDYGKKENFWLNSLGCTGLSGAFVASSVRDWYISRGGHIWDYAANSLILHEAGCIISKLDGSTWNLNCGEILTANPVLHAQLVDILST